MIEAKILELVVVNKQLHESLARTPEKLPQFVAKDETERFMRRRRGELIQNIDALSINSADLADVALDIVVRSADVSFVPSRGRRVRLPVSPLHSFAGLVADASDTALEFRDAPTSERKALKARLELLYHSLDDLVHGAIHGK